VVAERLFCVWYKMCGGVKSTMCVFVVWYKICGGVRGRGCVLCVV
jgi:hypothetical protein